MQMYLVSYPCEHDLSGGGDLTSSRGSDFFFFLNVEVKSINLVHLEQHEEIYGYISQHPYETEL